MLGDILSNFGDFAARFCLKLNLRSSNFNNRKFRSYEKTISRNQKYRPKNIESHVTDYLLPNSFLYNSILSTKISCARSRPKTPRSEEHTSELQSRENLVCRLLLEKKKQRHSKHS